MKKNLKFIRNIIITLFLLIIVVYVIDYAPNYKRDEVTDKTNIVIDNQNITAKLKYGVYIDENNNVYLSFDDVINYLDKDLYYETEFNLLIMQNKDQLSCINISDNSLTVNGVATKMKCSVLKSENVILIPISELGQVYNINTVYNKENNIIIVDFLDEKLIKAECLYDMKLKKWSTVFSRTIGDLKLGEKVFVVKAEKKIEGWTKVRTQNGLIGYIKDKSFKKEE